MERLYIVLAGVFGALGVTLGAFGAHGLRGFLATLPDGAERRAFWETAAHYHLVHALALGLAAFVASRREPSFCVTLSGLAFAGGIVLFSGSLYAMALTGIRALGAVTPFGGALFIAGWVAIAVAGMTGR